jgi:cysteine desulfurase
MDALKNIYLDYNATTPVDEFVLQDMLPFFSIQFANASSKTHFAGRMVSEAVERARNQTAHFLGAENGEIVFTSGSTESINLAIRGAAENYKSKGNHIITWQTEHKAVIDTCHYLENNGFQITRLSVDREGLPDLQDLEKAITTETILIAVMLANNETGVIMPVEQISKIAHDHNCIVFCDATQAAGKIRIDVNELHVDLLCISAHKMHGPKGTGVLFVRRKNPRVSIKPILFGGGHENGLRAGTLNVPGIVGLGKACEVANETMWEDSSRISKLRTSFEQIIITNVTGYVNGSIKHRLPNTTNICFPGIKSSSFITALPHLALATGSACTSALTSPSHVLIAMGLNETDALSSIRFSFGKFNTEEEIKIACDSICAFLKNMGVNKQK